MVANVDAADHADRSRGKQRSGLLSSLIPDARLTAADKAWATEHKYHAVHTVLEGTWPLYLHAVCSMSDRRLT